MCHIIDRVRASLSARRAWIEIGIGLYLVTEKDVALRKESVDRNDKSASGLVGD